MKKNQKYIILFFIPSIVLISLLLSNILYIIHEKENVLVDNISKTRKPAETIKEGNVVLEVLNDKYSQEIEEGDSVYDIMEKLKGNPKNNFDFNGKDYLSLGYFVEEINGISGTQGSYWIYSVNKEESAIGILNYKVKDGDIISWELK